MSFRAVVLALPCALALQAGNPRGDYNIKGGATMTSFPEFNVQYYYPGAAGAALHGTTEANNFAAALNQVLTKQAGVIEALEKSAKRAFLVEGSGTRIASCFVIGLFNVFIFLFRPGHPIPDGLVEPSSSRFYVGGHADGRIPSHRQRLRGSPLYVVVPPDLVGPLRGYGLLRRVRLWYAHCFLFCDRFV